MKLTNLISTIVAVTFFSSPSCALASGSSDILIQAEQQDAEKGSIIGTVIDYTDRTPLENATIEILGLSKKVQTTKTGQFTFTDVPKGFYQLRASANGYTPSVQNNLYIVGGKEGTAFFMLMKAGSTDSKNTDSAPVPVSTKSPSYPAEARKNGVEGIFYFKVQITETGSIKFAECIKMDVYAEDGKLKAYQAKQKYPQAINQMEKEALEAVWQWKFNPAMKDGKAIEAEVMLPIKYKLSKDKE